MVTHHHSTPAGLSDSEFMRYSRQLMLEDIGPEGQDKLKAACVLLVGLGGLGAPASLYLAAARSARCCLPTMTHCISATCNARFCIAPATPTNPKPCWHSVSYRR